MDRKGLGDISWRVVEYRNKFWLLVILESLEPEQFLAVELIRARTMKDAEGEAMIVTTFLVNPDCPPIVGLDIKTFAKAANAKDSLELLSRSDLVEFND